MRTIRLLFACLLTLASTAAAQMPRIGIIDFYGLRSLTPAHLAAALGLQIGDSVSVPRDVLEARLLLVPGVEAARVSAVCCEAGRTILYVGVRETGAAVPGFAYAPDGAEHLPDDILALERRYMDAFMEGVLRGQSEEDDTAGYALLRYPPARALQLKLVAYGAAHDSLVRAVLHNSADPKQRAIAAQMIAYAPDKARVVHDLVRSMRDPDATVRNNAVRALAVLAVYAQTHPGLDLHVPIEPFIDLLKSVEWTDRNKASFALTALTASRDPAVLDQLRKQALTELIEMARWKAIGHAAPSGIILGRIAGLPEDQIFEQFKRDRESVIAAAQE